MRKEEHDKEEGQMSLGGVRSDAGGVVGAQHLRACREEDGGNRMSGELAAMGWASEQFQAEPGRTLQEEKHVLVCSGGVGEKGLC